jgi:restriction system protein
MVRAGEHGEYERSALEHKLVAIGWEELPDLSIVKTKEELKVIYQQYIPDAEGMSLANLLGQVWAFVGKIQIGDLVALPLKTQSAIAIGRITGPYRYTTEFGAGMKHTRAVEWIKTDIPRTAFDQDILYSFGAFMTVCQIQRNNAEERVKAVLAGKPQPAPQPNAEFEADASYDLEQIGRDAIQEYINRKFKGHNLAKLINEILKVDGFFTKMSPPGADGGIDIYAGGGPMGFDEPMIIVQVKSSDAPADVNVLRSLLGVMTSHRAKQGLLVSWGGFKQTTIKEAENQFFEVRLWDAGNVIDAVLTRYDKLSETIQAELPLKRIWTLVQEE